MYRCAYCGHKVAENLASVRVAILCEGRECPNCHRNLKVRKDFVRVNYRVYK